MNTATASTILISILGRYFEANSTMGLIGSSGVGKSTSAN